METQHPNKENESKLHVGFFFLSLGFLITLITSVVAFLNLAFSTLDKKFPDVLNSIYIYGYTSYVYDGMRSSLATLIIFFPVLLAVAFFWNKKVLGVLGAIDIQIRKWFIYLVLFLSSLVVAIDLVILVRYFVAGEITHRFIYKVLVVLVVALFVGIYFIFQLQNKKTIWKFKIGLWSGIKASVLVIALVVFSFCVMGSPKTQRLLRLDERRVQDLQNIQYQVINYWQQKEKLPASLEDLRNSMQGGYGLPVDPEFQKGLVYEYKPTDKLAFDLCATFALPMPKAWSQYYEGYLPVSSYLPSGVYRDTISEPALGGVNDSWDHKEGYVCFSRTIDSDIYPPFNLKR